MIKAAIEYIVGLRKPEILDINGEQYSDKPLQRIKHIPKAAPITMSTLSSLVEYIKSNIDSYADKMIIHIQSPTKVSFYSKLDDERDRECIAEVNASIPGFRFNQFIDHETFCINLQSKFINDNDTDRALILKFAGTVEAGTVAEYGDDGITQKATIKTGIASKDEAVIPSPATLRPYRTFIEIDQPLTSFIFRMKQDKYDGIQCALYEADGGAWEIDAMENIKEYLKQELDSVPGITIIS